MSIEVYLLFIEKKEARCRNLERIKVNKYEDVLTDFYLCQDNRVFMSNERADGPQNMRLVVRDESPVQTSLFSKESKVRGHKFKKQYSLLIEGGPHFQIEPSKARLDTFFLFRREAEGRKLVGLLEDGKLDQSSRVDKLLYLSQLNLIPKNPKPVNEQNLSPVNTANDVKTELFETVMPETPSSSSSDVCSRDWPTCAKNIGHTQESPTYIYRTTNGVS